MSARDGTIAERARPRENMASPSPRSILAFIDQAHVTGPVRQLAAVAPALAARGWSIRCVVFQRRTADPVTSPGFLRAHGAEVVVIEEDGRFDVRLLSRVAAVIREHAPTVVQTHGYRPSVLLALLRLAGRLTTPWIGYFHGRTSESHLIRVYDRLDGIALRAADLVIVMSREQQEEKSGYGTPVHVLPNAVITPAPSHSAAEASPSYSGWPRPRVGVLARLSPEKGCDVLVRAWASLVAETTEGTLLIAGDGPERTTLEHLARELGVDDRTVFLGHVADVQSLYRELDALVLPSRSEGVPNVLLEAMRHAMHIVSTRVGGVPDIVGTSGAATLVPPDRPDVIADALRAVLGSPVPEATLRSRREIVERFSVPARAARIDALYRDLLASRAGGRA